MVKGIRPRRKNYSDNYPENNKFGQLHVIRTVKRELKLALSNILLFSLADADKDSKRPEL